MEWVKKLKDWWWAVGAVVAVSGIITFLVTAPKRLEAVEKKNAEQDTSLATLTSINETWQKIYQLQQQETASPAPWTFLREDGDWQVFRDPAGVMQCCDGRTCHPLTGRHCER